MTIQLKLWSAGIVSILCLFFVVSFIWDGRYWGAAAMLITLLSILYSIFFGFSFNDEIISGLGLLILACSAVQAFYSSDLSDSDLQDKNATLFFELISMPHCPVDLQPDSQARAEFRKLVEVAQVKCAVQGYQDMIELTVELQKSVYLNAEAGLIDTISTEFFSNTPKKVRCIDIVKAADKLCPNVFDTKLSSL